MENNNIQQTLVYNYSLNCYVPDEKNNRTFTSAYIKLTITPYKNGKEIKLREEPICKDEYLSSVIKVSFDKKEMFRIEKVRKYCELFCNTFGWDEIEYKTIGYSLEYINGARTKVVYGIVMPYEMEDNYLTMDISEIDFKKIINSNINAFDNYENTDAPMILCSYSF